MNKILALCEKRANLWNETKAFLDSHRGEDGILEELFVDEIQEFNESHGVDR